MSECALLKAAGQTHVLQTLVESNAECEVPKAAGQAHILETLVEVEAKCELLKATGQASPDSGQITLHNTNAFQQCPCYSLPVNHEFFFGSYPGLGKRHPERDGPSKKGAWRTTTHPHTLERR